MPLGDATNTIEGLGCPRITTPPPGFGAAQDPIRNSPVAIWGISRLAATNSPGLWWLLGRRDQEEPMTITKRTAIRTRHGRSAGLFPFGLALMLYAAGFSVALVFCALALALALPRSAPAQGGDACGSVLDPARCGALRGDPAAFEAGAQVLRPPP